MADANASGRSASFGYQGSLQRAVGHWVKKASAVGALEAWLREGPASLVNENTRLFRASSFHRSLCAADARAKGDLTFADARLGVGDWVLAINDRSPRGIALVRIDASGHRSAILPPSHPYFGIFAVRAGDCESGRRFEFVGALVKPRDQRQIRGSSIVFAHAITLFRSLTRSIASRGDAFAWMKRPIV
jgi:hypothetical protein